MTLGQALAHYLRRYRGLLVANLASNLAMVAFSVVSIPALIPFLQLLLQQRPLVTERPPWSWTLDGVGGNFDYWLTTVIVDHGYDRALVYACAIIIAVFLGKNLFRYLSLATLAPLRSNVIRDLRQDLFGHVVRLPVGYFTEQRRGDLVSRFTADVQEVENSALNGLQHLVSAPLLIVGALAVMLVISPFLTLFTIVLLGVTGLVIGGISRRLKRQSTEVQEGLGDMTAHIDEALGGLRVVKAFGAEGYVEGRFRKTNTAFRDALVRLLRRRDLSSPLSEFLGVLVVSVLIYVGYQRIAAGALDVAVFFAFIYAFFSTIEPSKRFSNAFYALQRGRAAYDRVRSVMDTPNPIADATAAEPVRLDGLHEAIAFEGVSFTYAGAERPALRDVSLRLPAGKVVALVGASGAGKSTVADLIPRFYDVDGGRITVDGHDVRAVRLVDLRALVGVVSQDVVLFNDTVAANVAFGSAGASAAELEAAARRANAHDFIAALPDGYQTVIGDRGSRLSGGQRQRLTIARAILRDAPVMVLDEATSALDAESERLVQAALFELMAGRTCLVIAHRMATIQAADEIYVMDEGRVIERGDHGSLLERGGVYAKLIELQRAS